MASCNVVYVVYVITVVYVVNIRLPFDGQNLEAYLWKQTKQREICEQHFPEVVESFLGVQNN